MSTTTVPRQRARNPVGSFGAGFVWAMKRMSGANSAAAGKREAERLFALSDAELAREGLTRDRILTRAYSRLFHV
jgi:hypothetical protein